MKDFDMSIFKKLFFILFFYFVFCIFFQPDGLQIDVPIMISEV